ncbi:MAG: ComE operon protein 1 [Calditrichaeota bacterium]|nr:ComE operon protein 1 [Calditrichota bacterium]
MQRPRRTRLAFTPIEKRTLLVLAVLLFVGLVIRQVERRRERPAHVTVEGAVGLSSADSARVTPRDAKPPSEGSHSLDLPSSRDVTSDLPAETPAGGRESAGEAGGDRAGRGFDLNTVTRSELESVPGIGPVLAGRILAWREEHGRFRRVEDLKLVSGIGEKRFANLQAHVYVGR